jgi:hypothetical protein
MLRKRPTVDFADGRQSSDARSLALHGTEKSTRGCASVQRELPIAAIELCLERCNAEFGLIHNTSNL